MYPCLAYFLLQTLWHLHLVNYLPGIYPCPNCQVHDSWYLDWRRQCPSPCRERIFRKYPYYFLCQSINEKPPYHFPRPALQLSKEVIEFSKNQWVDFQEAWCRSKLPDQNYRLLFSSPVAHEPSRHLLEQVT